MPAQAHPVSNSPDCLNPTMALPVTNNFSWSSANYRQKTRLWAPDFSFSTPILKHALAVAHFIRKISKSSWIKRGYRFIRYWSVYHWCDACEQGVEIEQCHHERYWHNTYDFFVPAQIPKNTKGEAHFEGRFSYFRCQGTSKVFFLLTELWFTYLWSIQWFQDKPQR